MNTTYIPKSAGKNKQKFGKVLKADKVAQLWPEAPYHVATALSRAAQIEAAWKEQKSRTIKAQSAQKSFSSMITAFCG